MPCACSYAAIFVFVLERQADVVEAVEQAMAAERLDFERAATGRGRR